MVDIPTAADSLMSILCESLVFGIYLVLSMYNIYLQCRNRQGTHSNKPNMLLLISSSLLFASITAHWMTNVSRIYEAVITMGETVTLDVYYNNIANPKQVASTGLYEITTIIADFILIYRLHRVYRSSWWICILPISTWLALIVSTGFLLYNMVNVSSGGIFAKQVKLWITCSWSLTIVTNVYCTSLISLRLWQGHRKVSNVYAVYHSQSPIPRILRVFVESAALMTIVALCAFITFETEQAGRTTLLHTSSPIIGISFTLILLRLNLNKEVDDSEIVSSMAQKSFPMRSVNVDVAQHVDIGWTAENGDYDASQKAGIDAKKRALGF